MPGARFGLHREVRSVADQGPSRLANEGRAPCPYPARSTTSSSAPSNSIATVRWRCGTRSTGRWTDIGYKEVVARVRGLSLGLLELDVRPGDHVAILSENRPEWAFADFACLAARCADVPIYPTLPPPQIEYILKDSGAVAIFVSSRVQLQKIEPDPRPPAPAPARHRLRYGPGGQRGAGAGRGDPPGRGGSVALPRLADATPSRSRPTTSPR